MGLYLLIGGLGILTGFLSGLVGIGGGIVMAPLLLYVPPLLGFEPLSMKVVAGLTIVQGLAACLAGMIAHRKLNFVSSRLAVIMGAAIFITALAGGAGSRYVGDRALLVVFAGLAMAAAVLMLIPVAGESENPKISDLSFSRTRAALAAGSVGLLGGLVGQGGSFILIPLMTSFVKIPTRIAIGTNLAIVLLSTTAAFIGKAVTGQIAWLLAVPLILVAVPATQVGSRISRRVPVKGLRTVLALLIAAAAVRIWATVLLA